MTTVASINTSNVTPEQIGACTKVFDANGKPFYKVVNSQELTDAEGHLIEYSVKAILKGDKYYLTCDCKAGNEGRLCWHKRASVAAAAEEKAALAEQCRLADEQKVKAAAEQAQREWTRATFLAARPEWFDTDQERNAFAIQYPELVALHQEEWEAYLVK